jgi:hypothetical protein
MCVPHFAAYCSDADSDWQARKPRQSDVQGMLYKFNMRGSLALVSVCTTSLIRISVDGEGMLAFLFVCIALMPCELHDEWKPSSLSFGMIQHMIASRLGPLENRIAVPEDKA